MSVPNFPTPVDDSGEGDDGTPVDAAWAALLEAAIEGVTAGADNPNIFAPTIIDEVIEARDGFNTLLEKLDSMDHGDDNPSVTAADIIDEVVEARDDNPDLNDRLENFVDDEIPDADATTRGLVSITAQDIEGLKHFLARPTFAPGSSVDATAARVNGTIYTDPVAHAGTSTTETTTTLYSLPANVLDADGRWIRVRAWGKTTSTGTHTRKFYWNGTSIMSPATDIVAAGWEFDVIIMRTGASLQTAICKSGVPVTLGVNTATPAVIANYAQTVWDNLNAALSGAVDIKVTVQDSADGAQIVQTGFSVEVGG